MQFTQLHVWIAEKKYLKKEKTVPRALAEVLEVRRIRSPRKPGRFGAVRLQRGCVRLAPQLVVKRLHVVGRRGIIRPNDRVLVVRMHLLGHLVPQTAVVSDIVPRHDPVPRVVAVETFNNILSVYVVSPFNNDNKCNGTILLCTIFVQ